jgi:hypothetical protein
LLLQCLIIKKQVSDATSYWYCYRLFKREGYTIDLFDCTFYNEIKIAEKFDEEGDAMFNKLGDEFDQKYRLNSSDQNTLDLHS